MQGCTACDCSEASESSQCDLETGQCECKFGVTGQKCDRCLAGFWNLTPDGCQSCGCNTEFAVGGTCNQTNGQCQCMRGVEGINCDHCPDQWVLVVNDTRPVTPEWKRPFDYVEGCFPCSSCVSDVLAMTDSLNRTLTPVMNEFEGVNSSYLAFQRLNYIQAEMTRLLPEVQLLNPQEGSRRLEPLENQVAEQQRLAKSLNIEYKKSIMDGLKVDAQKLQEKGQDSVDDMNRAGAEMDTVIRDMREIVDGLGSGVSPEQIEASVEFGRQWLEEIKQYNFSRERAIALEKANAARMLQETVSEFAEPVETFQERVSNTGETIVSLEERLQDLEDNSEEAAKMVRHASALNFRNSDPPASTKANRITGNFDYAETNNDMASSLVKEANEFLATSRDAYGRLSDSKYTMSDTIADNNQMLNDQMNAIIQNDARMTEAADHVANLEGQARGFNDTLDAAKTGEASRSLEAAKVYETIASAMEEAQEGANRALLDAEEAENMSRGVSEKATQSKRTTDELYDKAETAAVTVRTELQPKMATARFNVERVANQTKMTKQAVEAITSGIEELNEVTEVLKDTVTKANDAETLAHDALASIDARAEEITRNMAQAKKIQDDYADLKFAIEATKKSLEEIEAKRREKRRERRRQKRMALASGEDLAGELFVDDDDAEDEAEEEAMKEKVAELERKELQILDLTKSVSGMMDTLRDRIKDVRSSLSG